MIRYIQKPVFTAALLLSAFCSAAQTSATGWYDEGTKLFNKASYAEAVVAFDKAAELNPKYEAAYYRAGWCYNDLEQYEKAIDRLKKAVALKSTYHQAWQELGYAYKKTGRYDDALAALKKAIEAKSDYALAYKQLGDVYELLKKRTDAIQAYKTCYQYDRNNRDACYNIGYACNGLEQFDSALAWLRRANAIKETPETWNEIGFALYKQKKNDDAILAYRSTLRLKPENGTAYKGIGDVYRRNYSPARTDDAMENYTKAIQYNPKSAGSHFGLGWCLNEKGRYAEATEKLRKALELDRTLTAGYTELGYAQYMTTQYSDALATFRQGITLDGKNTLCRYYSGLVYIKLKDKTNAGNMVSELRPLDSKLADKLQAKIAEM